MKSMKLPAITLGALLLGVLTGLAFGSQALFLGILGKTVIQIIKSLAAPLLFLIIVESVIRSEPFGKKAGKLFLILLVNTTLAVGIGSGLSELIHPGSLLHEQVISSSESSELSAYTQKKIDWIQTIVDWIPKNPIQPFIDQSLISLVILALAFGLALRQIHLHHPKQKSKSVVVLLDVVDALLFAIHTMIHWVVKLVPLAVFGVAAQTTAKYGIQSIAALGGYLLTGALGLTLQCLVVYQLWLYFATRISLKTFWKESYEALTHAFGINSSLATLPYTLKSLDRMGVSQSSSRLGACVGTNFNNDGVLLYEAMAVLFIAQAHGIDLTLHQRVEALLACVIAGVGIAGIPEAGLISLALVIQTVGLPTEYLPLLLSVDWILARLRSVTNVIADMTVSAVLDGKSVVDESKTLP